MSREKDLVAGLRRGDEAAYETLVRTYGPRMLALARRYVPMEADAEDVLQNSFLLAFRFIARFAGACRLSTWLHRIVVNSALMLLRYRRRHPEAKLDAVYSDGEEGAGPDHQPAAARPADWEAVALKEDHGDLLRALELLPEKDRAAVRLCDVDGVNIAEAALLMDRCSTSVKADLRRGRAALRLLLAPAEKRGHVRGADHAARVRLRAGSPAYCA